MIYLLHFDPPYKRARHYLGFSEGDFPEDVDVRVGRHIGGQGSKLTKAAVKGGCTLILACTFTGGRDKERLLKKSHNVPRICPICNPRTTQ